MVRIPFKLTDWKECGVMLMRKHSNGCLKFGLGCCFLLMCLSAAKLQAKPLFVFACEPEWGALANVLAGGKSAGKVEVFSATTHQQDPHHIEARPSLIAKARKADLLVCTGAELEVSWLPLLLRQAANRDIQSGKPGYFMAAEQVELLDKPTVLDRSQGDVHAAGNPHIHLDPVRLLQVAEKLSLRLQKIDPDNASFYQQKLAQFKQDWQQAINNWQQRMEPLLKGKDVVVYHKNWYYLFAWLGINTVGDLEPRPGLPPTSAHLAKLLKQLKQQPADFILAADYQPKRPGKWLVDRTGIVLKIVPYTVDDIEDPKALFKLYETILTTLSQS